MIVELQRIPHSPETSLESCAHMNALRYIDDLPFERELLSLFISLLHCVDQLEMTCDCVEDGNLAESYIYIICLFVGKRRENFSEFFCCELIVNTMSNTRKQYLGIRCSVT